ncbi:MAG: NAD(P)/FAD-dependent oxidoreductase [Coprococcus sp.]
MDRVDIAIIGTGPAGVSAAITANVRNKSILLFGNRNMSDKIRKASQISNYPGLPDITGAELSERFAGHLDKMNIHINDERVAAVYAMGNYFAIQTAEQMYEAHSVILATGVVHGQALAGEKELLGSGVSYCATCDAQLYRGRITAVIGYSPEFEPEADFLAKIAGKVYYIPMYGSETHLSDAVTVIREIPVEIAGSMKVEKLITNKSSYDVDGVFVMRNSIAPERLVPGLEIKDNHISVNMQMETNLTGCFACGDVTGRPYQYIKAAGQGNVAALSAVEYLDRYCRN